jgi:protein-tyrosine kinase
MGKTHEALEWAEKERQASHPVRVPEPLSARRRESPKRTWTGPALKPYEDLKTNLLTRYPDGSIKTILFAGTAHGDGTSKTIINFAATLASDSQLKVLLIDVNLRTPSLHAVFRIDPIPGLSDLVANNGRGARPIKVGPGNLHVIPCGGPHSGPATLFGSNRFDQFLKRMRESYDFVVLDAPPIQGSSDCRVLCAKVDGVVLVIEAGKTRQHVALNAKRHLEEAGGKLLGVVLNRRRYYIPEFIYRRL